MTPNCIASRAVSCGDGSLVSIVLQKVGDEAMAGLLSVVSNDGSRCEFDVEGAFLRP